MRNLRRMALAMLLAGLVAFLAAGPAAAHAGLVSTDPVDGSVLTSSPTRVSLTFGEPVGLTHSGVTVLDDRGVRIDANGDESVDGAVISQPLPKALGDGWYVVVWSAISDDGHVVKGAFTFGVGNADAAARARVDALAAEVDSSTPAAQLVLRPIADVFTMVAVGAALAVLLLGAQSVAVRRLLAIASRLGVLATIALAISVASEVGDAGTWAGRTNGWAVIARIVLLFALQVLSFPLDARATPPAERPGAGRIARLIGGPAACGVILSYAFVGHVRSLGAWWIDGPLLGAHLVAAAVWLGAAPAMALYLASRKVADDDAARASLRFSNTATVAMPIVIVAGAVLGWRATDGRWTAAYTGRLVVKAAIVLLAALLGAIARRRVRDATSRPHLLRVFAVDSGLLLVATVLAASISSTRPPVHIGGAHNHAPSVVGASGSTGSTAVEIGGCSADVSGLAVRVSLSPGRVGANDVRLTVGWKDANTPGTMVLRLTSTAIGAGTLDVSLEAANATSWVGRATFPVAGIWAVEVDHRPDEFTVRRGSCQLSVG